MKVEELDILVGARGITKTISQLEQVADSLRDIAEMQQLVDKKTIDIDVRDGEVDEALGKVGALGATSAARGAGPPGARASGGVSADGGGLGGGGGFSPERLRRMMNEFGDAFDPDAVLRSRGVLSDPLEALDADASRFFDTGEMARLVSEGVLDSDVFEDPFGNLGALRRRGLTSLPRDRSWTERLQKFAEGLDMTALNNLFASLVPLLGVFIGALPSAIAGLIALAGAALGAAAALVGVAGLGALGMGMDGQGGFDLSQLTDVLKDIRDDFLNAFGPLANQLQPLFERGLDGLSRFFDALAARGDVLTAFSEEAIAFGAWLSSGLVNVLTVFTQLADASSEAFGAIAEGLDAADTAEFLAFVIQETLPALAMFVGVLRDVMPAIIELSAGFLYVSADIIKLLHLAGWLIGTFLTLGGVIPLEVIGALIGALLLAITATALKVKAVALLGETWVANAIPAMKSAIANLYTYATASTVAFIKTVALTAAVAALVGVLTMGLGPALAGASNDMDILGGKFRKATEDLKRFNAERGSMGSFGGGPRGGSASTYVDVTQTTNVESTGNKRKDNQLSQKAAYHNSQVTDRNFSN